MDHFNILIGGKLGDFLLGLYGAYGISKKLNKKARIYMIDIGWDFGIQNTYDGLYPILMQQEYIDGFEILTDYDLDPIQTPQQNSPIQVFNKTLLGEGYIVDDYLNSPLLYKKCWSDIYSNLFDFSIQAPNSWISVDEQYSGTQGKVLIHRKFSQERFNTEFPYEQIIDKYENNVIFVSTNVGDYEQFPFKDRIPFIKVNSLLEWYSMIHSCEMFVGNLTAPIVIAHSMDKMRIVELPNNIDAYHWMGEEKYSKNIFWFLNNDNHNLC
jgi:hypothetical protein